MRTISLYSLQNLIMIHFCRSDLCEIFCYFNIHSLSIFTHLLATKLSSVNAYSYPLPILLTSSLLLLLDLLIGLLFIFWILFCCQLFRLQISSPNLQLIVFPFMEFVLHKALNIVKFINILLHEKCFWCLQKLFFMRSQGDWFASKC